MEKESIIKDVSIQIDTNSYVDTESNLEKKPFIKDMTTLLVVPHYNNYEPNRAYDMPHGMMYVSSFLKSKGHHVDVLNLNHYSKDKLLDTLVNNNYDVVATCGFYIHIDLMHDILETVKGHCSDTITIVGGAASTADPEFLLEELPADFMIIGEGEYTADELITAIQEGQTTFSNIPGIGYMDEDNKYVNTGPRQLIDNLDELPFPDYEGFEYSTYTDKYFKTSSDLASIRGNVPRRGAAMITSRDCIMKCTFCFRIMGETVNEPSSSGTTYRTRSLDNVFEEINYLVDTYKINELDLMDDMFAAKPSRVIEFSERLTPYKILWSCQLRASSAREKVLPKMKESGCWQISYGFESGSPKVLKSMKKGTRVEHIANAIELNKKNKVGIQGNFIYGDPAEDLDTLKETIVFTRNYKDLMLGYGMVIPYPGTSLYKNLVEKKIIDSKKDFYFMPRHYNMTELNDVDYSYMFGKVNLEEKRRQKPLISKILSVEKQGDLFTIKAQCACCRAANEMQLTLNSLDDVGVFCKECYRKFLVGGSNKKIRKLLSIRENFSVVARRFFEYEIIRPIIFSSPYVYRLIHPIIYSRVLKRILKKLSVSKARTTSTEVRKGEGNNWLTFHFTR